MDLSVITDFLSTLGPWGMVAGAALVIAVQYFGVKIPFVTPNVVPVTPSPLAPVTPSLFPNLRALLDAWFKSKGAKTPEDLATLDPSYLATLWTEIDSLVDAKTAKTTNELTQLK